MTAALHSTSSEEVIEIRRLSVQDYHHMLAAGILASDEPFPICSLSLRLQRE